MNRKKVKAHPIEASGQPSQSKKTITFRAAPELARALEEAVEATKKTQTEIICEALSAELDDAVCRILAAQKKDVEQFLAAYAHKNRRKREEVPRVPA